MTKNQFYTNLIRLIVYVFGISLVLLTTFILYANADISVKKESITSSEDLELDISTYHLNKSSESLNYNCLVYISKVDSIIKDNLKDIANDGLINSASKDLNNTLNIAIKELNSLTQNEQEYVCINGIKSINQSRANSNFN